VLSSVNTSYNIYKYLNNSFANFHMILCTSDCVISVDRFQELRLNDIIYCTCIFVSSLASEYEKLYVVLNNISVKCRNNWYVSDRVPLLPAMSQFRCQRVRMNNLCNFASTVARLSTNLPLVVSILPLVSVTILVYLCKDMSQSAR
jgi:hypothetical protein